MRTFNSMYKTIQQLFTNHPNSIGETYSQHFIIAAWIALRAITAGIICFLHALFPFLFQKTASSILENIVREFENRKNKSVRQ